MPVSANIGRNTHARATPRDCRAESAAPSIIPWITDNQVEQRVVPRPVASCTATQAASPTVPMKEERETMARAVPG